MRYLMAITGAGAVTVGLFLLMHSLIAMSEARLGDDTTQRVIDFVRLKHESTVQTKKRELPQRQKMEQQPTPPDLDLNQSPNTPSGESIAVSAPAVPEVSNSVNLSGGPTLGSAPSDAGEIPLVRIQPVYPPAAAQRRIEGWVRIEFTISVKGTVKNAHVIASHPPRIFDRAALKAIRKWKYKPKIIDGKAQETQAVQVQLSFKLED